MTDHARPRHSGASLTLERVHPYEHRGIAVVSDALDVEGRIADLYSAYHDDRVPGLAWSAVIEAESYALVVEDPDAPMAEPFVHWMVWNIPGTATAIAPGLSRVARPPELPGAIQGKNSAGTHGWYGTKPPQGHGLHHYHFQLFALNTTLDHLDPNIPLAELVNVLKGITIAAGEVVGTYERRDPVADAASPGRTGGYGEGAHADTVRQAATGRGGLDADDLDRHAPHSLDGTVQRG